MAEEKNKEYYPLDRIGPVEWYGDVMVEHTDMFGNKTKEPPCKLLCVEHKNARDGNRYIVWNPKIDRILKWGCVKHYDESKVSFRPMNFEEVCALVSQGAVFVCNSEQRFVNPCVEESPGLEVIVNCCEISEIEGYTLPGETELRKLEVRVD